MNMYCSRQG